MEAAACRRRRQPNKPKAPSALARSGSVPGKGVATDVRGTLSNVEKSAYATGSALLAQIQSAFESMPLTVPHGPMPFAPKLTGAPVGVVQGGLGAVVGTSGDSGATLIALQLAIPVRSEVVPLLKVPAERVNEPSRAAGLSPPPFGVPGVVQRPFEEV